MSTHTFFHSHQHVDHKMKKAKPRVKILRILCYTSLDQQKKKILATFKSLISTLFTCAAPI